MVSGRGRGCHDAPVPEPEDVDVNDVVNVGVDVAAAQLFAEVLRRVHLCQPSDLPDVVVQEAQASLGASDVVLYLVNYEHTALVPVPSRHSPLRAELAVEGSMAGRAFTTSTILPVETGDGDGAGSDDGDGGDDEETDVGTGVGTAARIGTATGTGAQSGEGRSVEETEATPRARARRWRLWLPLLDGTDRLGIMELSIPAEEGQLSRQLMAVCERYAHLVAQAVISKNLYGDVFELVRRSQAMTVASELLHAMLPPPMYATQDLVVAAMLEPTYDNGGDAFDYAVNASCAHLAVFDGMGHGLAAAGVTTFALAAHRNARRGGLGLMPTYIAVNDAILSQFGGERHVTAVLAELDMNTGHLTWISAGHPPPLLLREGKVVKVLQAQPSFPLGWPFDLDVVVAEESLQPADSVLLYTDGLIEARRPDRSLLGMEGLADFLEQEAAAALPPPETLRRLRRTLLTFQDGVLHDDATALLLAWRGGGEHALMPQTVE